MKKNIKKILAASTISLLLLPILYTAVVEPTLASAVTTMSDNVVVTLNVDSGITISDGLDSSMSPNLGITANSSTGYSSWIVKTNNTAGYKLDVKSLTDPALKSGVTNNLADYTETAGTCSNVAHTTKATCVGAEIWTPTPETWSISSSTKEFGYSAYGPDVPVKWGTTAVNCGTAGSPNPLLKYVGFTTKDNTIATLGSVTPVSGVTTNICFQAQQNSVYADSGTYTATITATASVL